MSNVVNEAQGSNSGPLAITLQRPKALKELLFGKSLCLTALWLLSSFFSPFSPFAIHKNTDEELCCAERGGSCLFGGGLATNRVEMGDQQSRDGGRGHHEMHKDVCSVMREEPEFLASGQKAMQALSHI